MNYLARLEEDEVHYICSVIPIQDSIYYFKRYPKDFAKVMPGFRAKSMRSQEQVSGLLFKNRNHTFIMSFIDKHINKWIEEIQKNIDQVMDDGAIKESALLQTLPFSFFVDNVRLYFKLINEEYSEEHMLLFSEAIKTIRDTNANREKLEENIKEKESRIIKLQSDLEYVHLSLDRLNKDYYDKNKALNYSIHELEKLKTLVQIEEKEISIMKSKIETKDKYIKHIEAKLSELEDNFQFLESKIRFEFEKINENNIVKEKLIPKPKTPIDLEEFKDYLGYNLENIGLSTDSEYFFLLKEHLCCILFQGKPILINKVASVSLMKCVSNALFGTTTINTLVFMNNISEQVIDEYLSMDVGIICLDNFIGNFNETVLLTLCDKHKDKIIFLTVAYDRTIFFIPDEFLKYCHYLNLNRIDVLSANVELTEDPSIVEMVIATPNKVFSDIRYSTLLREILSELEFRQSLVFYKSALVTEELNLCSFLAFDIIPYCVDVMESSPYNVSERFVKYVGDTGRCPYKNWIGYTKLDRFLKVL